MPVEGFDISASFTFAADVGRQCDLLAAVLKNELFQAISTLGSGTGIDAQQWTKVSYRNDPSGWVCSDIAYSLPLAVSSEVIGWLGFQISLCGTGISHGGNQEPLIHVCFWTGAPITFPDYCMGFPLMDGTAVEEGVLLDFTGEGDSRPSWTYSLRLTSVNGPNDIREKIVKPAVALLTGVRLDQALPSSIGGVALYSLAPPAITFR